MKLRFTLSIIYCFLTFLSCQNQQIDQPIVCTEVFIQGLHITLVDAASSEIITEDVTIIATDGNFKETLKRIETQTSFSGAGERAGTYVLTITSSNYMTFVSNPIVVSADECHVMTEFREFKLQAK
jgi:hypothetical protein